MTFPNLFIVGAARSGTTFLWNCLKENPKIFMPREMALKEPAYFSPLKKTSFNRWEEYKALFAPVEGTHRWVGEASTAYLSDPDSAGLIHKHNPRAAIIIVLRNPVHRAYSLYRWMVQDGYEYAPTFERALELEDTRKHRAIPNYYEPEYYYNYQYFQSGLYYQQVKRYIDLFDDNVLILEFGALKNNFRTEYDRVCRFLDVGPNPVASVPRNESLAVTTPVRQFLLRKMTRFCLLRAAELERLKREGQQDQFKQMLKNHFFKNVESLEGWVDISYLDRKFFFPVLVDKIARGLYSGQLAVNNDSKKSRDALLDYGLKKGRPPKIKKQTALWLKEKYREDVGMLSRYTGLDFSQWGMMP